jgi:hypothetical protein
VDIPYELLFDYRSREPGRSWGKVEVRHERYASPPVLAAHRANEVMARGPQLYKGDLAAARVQDFRHDADEPTFVIQQATYYDHVGTNLSLDVPLSPPVWEGGRQCRTVRDWDVAQAGLPEGALPPLSRSALANTLGVAIALGVVLEDGSRSLLRRMRSERLAVYQSVWHVPWSFSFSPPSLTGSLSLREYLSMDLGHEMGMELGLHPSEISPLTPIAFTRDLTHGGKPQLFFFAECQVPFGEVCRRLAAFTDNEFTGTVELEDGRPDLPRSDELRAMITLMDGWPRGGDSSSAPSTPKREERCVFRRDTGGTWTVCFGGKSMSGVPHLAGFMVIRECLRGTTGAGAVFKAIQPEKIENESKLDAQRKSLDLAMRSLRQGNTSAARQPFPEFAQHLDQFLTRTPSQLGYHGPFTWDTGVSE